MDKEIDKILQKVNNRYEFCSNIINDRDLKNIIEIGVYKGEFAEFILKNCISVENYYMIDPWKNISDWNKPLNIEDSKFEECFNETILRTNFASEKRTVLRGKTQEVIKDIPDNSVDLIYIDGEHTLKGITIDLLLSWNKVKDGGIIIGDDFIPSIWHHNLKFEPSFVFPFSIYFAEAMQSKIYGLPFNQFLIQKLTNGYHFKNLTDVSIYFKQDILNQFKNYLELIKKS